MDNQAGYQPGARIGPCGANHQAATLHVKYSSGSIYGISGNSGMVTPEIENDELLRAAEAASLLDLSPRTVTEKLRTREIDGFKIGRQWRVYRSRVEAYLKSVQLPGIDPPSMQRLHSSAQEAARTKHRSKLLHSFRIFRASLAYLIDSDGIERNLRGVHTEVHSPEFDRVTWRSIQQHLTETEAHAAWQAWRGSAISLLELERAIFERGKELGETEFGVPLLPTQPETGGRLTEGFAATIVALARSHDDPAEAIQDRRVTWQEGELRFSSNYSITTGTGLTESETRIRFGAVVRNVVDSERAIALRSSLERHTEATHRFEDELDGIELKQSISGVCDWCAEL